MFSITLRKFFSIPALLSVLIWKVVEFCQMLSVCCLIWFCFSPFHSINTVYYINQFSHVEPPLLSWSKSHFVVVCNPFVVLLNLVHYYFVENFCICVHQGYWSLVFFSCYIFVWLWYQGTNLILTVYHISLELWNLYSLTSVVYIKFQEDFEADGRTHRWSSHDLPPSFLTRSCP